MSADSRGSMGRKPHQAITATDAQPDKLGSGAADGISGSTTFDWRDGDFAPQYNKHLRGFEGIKRTGMNAGKQIQGYQGPAKKGSASAPEARDNDSGRPYRPVATNANFDGSAYQSLLKSMHGGHLGK